MRCYHFLKNCPIKDVFNAVKAGFGSNDGWAAAENPIVMDHIIVDQEVDTLDNDFVAALATFANLGWPTGQGGENKLLTPLSRRFPTDALCVGADECIDKVGKLLMISLACTSNSATKKVYVRRPVVDHAGKELNLTNGNILDPTDFVQGRSNEDLGHVFG